jgi:signal transduction histidine kinase
MYNAACLDLLDTNDSLKGKNIGKLFNLKNKDNEKANLVELLKKADRTTRRDDLNHVFSDNESIRLEITFAPIRSNYSLKKRRDELNGYILIMRDVTKQKSLEEERDEFISVVSHELRTPITIVEGTLSNLDVMMQQPTKPSEKILISSINTAHEQVLYLAKMVNDLSTLSRAERGIADAPEVIDVKELLQTMHQRYEGEAGSHKLSLNLDLGTKLGKVNVSRLYLEELLQNFITNAIKYTHEGSITIAARRTAGTVSFTVKDTGIGMSRTDQNKIFNKFYRSEDYRIRETNGTGLGLYVSAKLANKLGTQIALKSRINYGSEFSFELPAVSSDPSK